MGYTNTNKQPNMKGNPFIVFVLGPPASGKGTMCTRLATDYNLYHLSVGDYLRYLIRGPLADQADIVDAVRSGGTRGLVSGDVIVSLLMEKIKEEMKRGESVFLLDGFPRSLEQDSAFKSKMKEEFDLETTPDLTISISCTREVAKARYLGRKRVDDSPQLFDQRYSDYEKRDSQVVELHREGLVDVGADAHLSMDQAYNAMLEALSRSSSWRALVTRKGHDGGMA